MATKIVNHCFCFLQEPSGKKFLSSKWRNFVLQMEKFCPPNGEILSSKWRNFVLQMEKFRPPNGEISSSKSGEILSPKWRNFVPQVEKFCPPSGEILSPKQDILYQTYLQKIRINTRLFYVFFIHASCSEICIRLIRLIRLITGTPPPLDGRGAVPYPYRYLQKNQTTKKYQFLFRTSVKN